METFDENAVHLELKYCERCGGLWLRLKGSELAFCTPCAVLLSGVARDPRILARNHREQHSALQQMSENAWSEGGNA
jgi:Zn-finger nucleic acid-binding protein